MQAAFLFFPFSLLFFIYSNEKSAGPYLWRVKKKIYCEFIPAPAQFAMTGKARGTSHRFILASKYCHSVKLCPLKYKCGARDGNRSSGRSLHHTQGYLSFFDFVSGSPFSWPRSSPSRGLLHPLPLPKHTGTPQPWGQPAQPPVPLQPWRQLPWL